MAYNYLGLVNAVNRRVNEVELSSSNFTSAVGFYSTAKDAVNAAINRINFESYLWPFNFVAQEDTLVAGILRYPFPTNAKVVDFNTFRIKRNNTFNNKTVHLIQMDYEEYLGKYIDDEYNTSTGIRATPKYVVRTPNREYLVYPTPDQAYELVYEYYTLPTELMLYSDVPTIPEAFKDVIVEYAMYYVYLFRGDTETADRMLVSFKEKLKDMRAIFVNRYEYVRDTRIRG